MTEEQSGIIVAADGDLREIVGGHEIRLAAVERRQDATDGKLDGISKDLATMRAEENARTVATTAGISRLEVRVFDLVTQLAKLTGAQENQNRLAEENLRRWRTRSVIVGIICTIAAAAGGTILSSQTWDDYLFGNVGFLHRYHIPVPAPQPQPQGSVYALAPRGWEKS